MIYLDNNATTAVCQAAIDAAVRVWHSNPANPSSSHAFGRRSAALLADILDALLELLGGATSGPNPDRIVLTSGGTESNNMALAGLAVPSRPIVISAIEHPSVVQMAEVLRQRGYPTITLPVDGNGVVETDRLKQILARDRPGLVSVMLANNETGAIQPVAEIAALCREHGAAIHTDAAQAVGKIEVDFQQLGVDALTVAAHKFHGPVGVGALIVRAGATVDPLLVGGEQQLGSRGGTEALALAAAMEAAAIDSCRDLGTAAAEVTRLRDLFESQLAAQIPSVIFHGASTERLPGTSCFSLPGVDRQAMLMALDLAGVACSSGSACASGSNRPSSTLAAMEVAETLQQSALRCSFSRFSTQPESVQAVEHISRCFNKLQR